MHPPPLGFSQYERMVLGAPKSEIFAGRASFGNSGTPLTTSTRVKAEGFGTFLTAPSIVLSMLNLAAPLVLSLIPYYVVAQTNLKATCLAGYDWVGWQKWLDHSTDLDFRRCSIPCTRALVMWQHHLRESVLEEVSDRSTFQKYRLTIGGCYRFYFVPIGPRIRLSRT